jgi:hypothetical protein
LYVAPTDTRASQSCTTNAQCLAANSRCCNSERCLKSNTESFPSTSPGKCQTRWTLGDTDRNPRGGTCDCPTGTYYLDTSIGDYVTKTCSVDPCGEGGTKAPGTQICECKPGYISCGVTPSSNVMITDARCASTTTVNRCIRDPCAPGGTMRRGGGCTCTTGYTEVSDSNAIGGKVCKDACFNNGPCGNRGKCVIINGQAQCSPCYAPYTGTGSTIELCGAVCLQYGQTGMMCTGI